jgi:hypothetical protein
MFRGPQVRRFGCGDVPGAPKPQLRLLTSPGFGFRESWKLSGSGGWMQGGTTLCVALDLGSGTVQVAMTLMDGQPLSWINVKNHGACPSAAAGSNIFPVISGKGGIGIKYNFGNAGQMLHSPPSPEYKTVSEASTSSWSWVNALPNLCNELGFFLLLRNSVLALVVCSEARDHATGGGYFSYF